MRIGELALAAATPIETIRYYERVGLLPAPARTPGNFRVYETVHLERLRFIRYCRSLDMSLAEVRTLLHFRDAPTEDCTDVNALLDEHIGHVTTRIEELRALQTQLEDLRRRCVRIQEADRCGILTGLSRAAARQEPSEAREASHLRPLHGH